jgi:23S rRNA (cytosine1962-C5)-methyltransferase
MIGFPSLVSALDARAELLAQDPQHHGALRLFNGHTEGDSSMVVEVYGRTVLLHDRSEGNDSDLANAQAMLTVITTKFPWIRAGVWKVRRESATDARNGRVILGELEDVDTKVREGGVWYAVDLMLHRDASLYLDTRALRTWLREHSESKRVLNTFAYTGSLGVAARAGHADTVVQTDRSKEFLALVQRSYALNGLTYRRRDHIAGDFFAITSRLRGEKALFDTVLVDPPFFSTSREGTVDMETSALRLLDKVRPLIADGGALVAVNNALWVSGSAWMATLERICNDGYATVEQTMEVPQDCLGMSRTDVIAWPSDPSPWNHPTKIAVLRMRRKDRRKST